MSDIIKILELDNENNIIYISEHLKYNLPLDKTNVLRVFRRFYRKGRKLFYYNTINNLFYIGDTVIKYPNKAFTALLNLEYGTETYNYFRYLNNVPLHIGTFKEVYNSKFSRVTTCLNKDSTHIDAIDLFFNDLNIKVAYYKNNKGYILARVLLYPNNTFGRIYAENTLLLSSVERSLYSLGYKEAGLGYFKTNLTLEDLNKYTYFPFMDRYSFIGLKDGLVFFSQVFNDHVEGQLSDSINGTIDTDIF